MKSSDNNQGVGSRSMERFEETAILLTVAQTCRFQGRSVMQFLREALMANAHQGLPPPTLIPTTLCSTFPDTFATV